LAQGLIDNLSNTEGGLVCREVIAALDLNDSTLTTLVTSNDWRQPVLSDVNFGTHAYATTTGNKTAKVQIYATNTLGARNDRKIYVAWGLRQVGSGPARDHAVLSINAWLWYRSDVKIIDWWNVQQLETVDGQAVYGQTPILYN
jgi:hypothetical protein